MVRLKPGVKIQKVALGFYHVLALSTENRVLSWGAGLNGQLGHGKVDKEVNLKFNSGDF